MGVAWKLGAYEIGVLFSTTLFGFVSSQAFRYTQEKYGDPIWLKILVLVACILDTTHTVAMWSLLYFWSVNNFGNPDGLIRIHWMFVLNFAVTPFMAAVVQSFYAYRMFLLLKRPYLPLLVWFGAATRVGFGIYRIIPFSQSKTIPQLVRHHGWLLETALAINVGLDILNTVGLLFCLLKNRPTLVRSRKMVDTLSRYTIEIGLSTSLYAIVTLVVVHYRAHQNFIFLGLLALYPKLYTNSLLASLNSRVRLRQISSSTTDINIEVPHHRNRSNLFDVAKIVRRPKKASTASSGYSHEPPLSESRIT